MYSELETRLITSMKNLDEDQVYLSIERLLNEGYDKYQIYTLLDKGTIEVGRLFEEGEYFIADLIVSGIIYADVVTTFSLIDTSPDTDKVGHVLIGVVEADIHEIGKDIICNHLRSEGFQVTDLGVDVPPAQFIEAAHRLHPDIIALSGVMAASVGHMENTVKQLELAGVRSFASIVIGGACVNESVAKIINADAWAKTPYETVKTCLAMVKNNEPK